MSKAQYFGMSCNNTRFGLLSLAYNIKRGFFIQSSLRVYFLLYRQVISRKIPSKFDIFIIYHENFSKDAWSGRA